MGKGYNIDTCDLMFGRDFVDCLHAWLFLQFIPILLGGEILAGPLSHLDSDPTNAGVTMNLPRTNCFIVLTTSWRVSHLTGLVGSKPHLELLHLLAGGDILDLEEEPLVVVRGQGFVVELLGCYFTVAANS